MAELVESRHCANVRDGWKADTRRAGTNPVFFYCDVSEILGDEGTWLMRPCMIRSD